MLRNSNYTITLKALPKTQIIHNRGCGINYVQRNGKIPFENVPLDCWFLKEKLSRRIAIDIPWSRLEPKEGHYLWEDSEWEGCFNSWIKAGFHVILKVRGMDTLGTLYNQGTPQWVFDAGAEFVDEPIEPYRSGVLLNDIPDQIYPIRYPVYWDPVYLEKAASLITALGKRYNSEPAVDAIAMGHMGRWGEMHIAAHLPIDAWVHKGYSLKVYNQAFRFLTDLYQKAFPGKELQQSICPPHFQTRWPDALECLEYLAERKIVIKYDGLGYTGWDCLRSPYMDAEIYDFAERFRGRTKIAFENMVLPEALQTGLDLQMSYWQRGGESSSLRELEIDKTTPIREKKLVSFYKFFQERYDAMGTEELKEQYRHVAQKCGFRLGLRQLIFVKLPKSGELWHVLWCWENCGCAPCYEDFELVVKIETPYGVREIFCATTMNGCGPSVWKAESSIMHTELIHIPANLRPGSYRLMFGLKLRSCQNEFLSLDNEHPNPDGTYSAGMIEIKNS